MDISRDEDAGVIPVVVEILNQRILATPVSFLLTPQLSTLADRVPASISKCLIFLSCALFGRADMPCLNKNLYICIRKPVGFLCRVA